MKTKIIAVICFFSFICTAHASMPFYNDDVEFERCTRMTGDWERCIREETRRELNDLKVFYREILGNPKLAHWNESMENNQNMLRDMYTSWTAFRNRLCSLSKVSARFTGGWKDEELSCNLYYVLHHKDHLQCINDMMQGRADERDNFVVEEHDEKYIECLKKSPVEQCVLAEFQRSTDDIKEMYRKFYESQNTHNWNNGTEFGNGNYRDMFDSWVAYRNRFCSLSAYAYKYFPGKELTSKNKCLQYLNREKLETLKNLYKLSISAVNNDKLQKKAEEGGRAAGEAITPLENRVESTESLTGTKEKEDGENLVKQEENSANDSNLPAWARKK